MLQDERVSVVKWERYSNVKKWEMEFHRGSIEKWEGWNSKLKDGVVRWTDSVVRWTDSVVRWDSPSQTY